MAVPDQTLTVKQIYEKHRRQMPIPEKQVYYESEVGFTAQLHNLDKQDRIELLKTVKHNISKARGEYDRQTEEQQKAQEQITQPPLTPETQSA
nr:MAG: hypothetical protein [Microvirus sp.]